MQFILNYIFKLHIKIMLKESKKMWIIITILAVVSLCQAGAIARLMIDNHELKYRVDRVSAVRSSVLSYMIDPRLTINGPMWIEQDDTQAYIIRDCVCIYKGPDHYYQVKVDDIYQNALYSKDLEMELADLCYDYEDAADIFVYIELAEQ